MKSFSDGKSTVEKSHLALGVPVPETGIPSFNLKKPVKVSLPTGFKTVSELHGLVVTDNLPLLVENGLEKSQSQ